MAVYTKEARQIHFRDNDNPGLHDVETAIKYAIENGGGGQATDVSCEVVKLEQATTLSDLLDMAVEDDTIEYFYISYLRLSLADDEKIQIGDLTVDEDTSALTAASYIVSPINSLAEIPLNCVKMVIEGGTGSMGRVNPSIMLRNCVGKISRSNNAYGNNVTLTISPHHGEIVSQLDYGTPPVYGIKITVQHGAQSSTLNGTQTYIFPCDKYLFLQGSYSLPAGGTATKRVAPTTISGNFFSTMAPQVDVLPFIEKTLEQSIYKTTGAKITDVPYAGLTTEDLGTIAYTTPTPTGSSITNSMERWSTSGAIIVYHTVTEGE